MVDGLEKPLPWVPDLVGLGWQQPESLIVIGSAYAPFIRGLSKRRCTMPLADYVDARSASRFLSKFLESVVIPDTSYYSKIALLAGDLGTQQRVIIFDLCRASYTIRGSRKAGNDLDGAAEFTFKNTIRNQRDEARANQSRRLFTAYVESKKQREWTLERLALSRARRIVTLGTIAEYGFLKLLWHSGIKTIHRMRNPNAVWSPDASHGDQWMLRYAAKGQTLEKWLTDKDWWIVKGRLKSDEREWHVLPVLHPAARNSTDIDYLRTRALIMSM